MKVILKEEIRPLGKPGDIVNVADGYARNFLFPKKKAMPATAANVKNLEQFKKTLLKKQEHQKALVNELAQKLSKITCEISKKVGEKDKLFGAVTSQEIHDLLKAQGYDIAKRKIALDEPIKTIGNHPVIIKLDLGITATINVVVKAEKA